MKEAAQKAVPALLAVLLLASAFPACGEQSTTTSSSSTSDRTSTRSESAGSVETGPLTISANGSGSYRKTGRYTGVSTFGDEASKAELREVARTQHDYLVARVEKDWSQACIYTSKVLLHRLSLRSENLAGTNCAAILAALTMPGPGGSDYESSTVEAESLRTNGERAFLLYRAAAAPYFMSMIREDGAWKVASIAPTPFY
jgi:hypothetical protein